MRTPRKNVSQLYLSDEEIAMLDGLRDKFTSEWEKVTGVQISKAEIVRRMIHKESHGGIKG